MSYALQNKLCPERRPRLTLDCTFEMILARGKRINQTSYTELSVRLCFINKKELIETFDLNYLKINASGEVRKPGCREWGSSSVHRIGTSRHSITPSFRRPDSLHSQFTQYHLLCIVFIIIPFHIVPFFFLF